MLGMKAQSAMEYLMTYSWAIVVIAIVVGVLYYFGIFNPITFAAKAPPGACQVYRPNGAGTSTFVNFQGACNNQIPEFVAEFNGQSSYVQVPYSPSLNPAQYSASAWIYVTGGNGNYRSPITSRALLSGNTYGYIIYATSSNQWSTSTGALGGWDTITTNNQITLDNWTMVTATYNGAMLNLYINGQLAASGGVSYYPNSNAPLRIGAGATETTPPAYYLYGSESNVQIYNTSLSANEVAALYSEGIGGDPQNLQHLVGWWPLNGNPYDYSGNGYNGTANAIIYSGTWYVNYAYP